MEDKEVQTPDGQADESQPQAEQESPEVADETNSPAEADKELTEWATNKGYSAEDLQDEKLSKAIKMARNAEKFAGKQKSQSQDEATDEELDKYLNEILGEDRTPQDTQTLARSIGDIDVSQLPPNEQALLQKLTADITKSVEAKFAPQLSALKRQEMKGELDTLRKEFGDDVIKNAIPIIKKAQTGMSLRDATVSVLSESLLKKSRSEGIAIGKKAEQEAVRQQTEEVKKTAVKPSLSDEWDSLSIEEQEKILIDLQSKG